ncbi:fatty-acyl-CoA synthase [Haloechinothrix alba]|uniref:Fatty-acyl-CoA synthase n=1 Tax=Haloechinothrix alba TaxID=664784 RepID=A0A238ZH80_9PSEU|nr:AMP-binding protein [Haloechinothrix alba]SNR82836.1 fatty-acyl-CoA synthase [Haloechinothrix alba]
MHLAEHARRDPDSLALVVADTGLRMTYGELDDRSARVAGLLQHAGLREGDVVALLTENSVLSAEVYWAAMRRGLSFTPVDHSLGVEEIAYVINDSGARALFISESMSELAGSLAALTPHVEVRFVRGSGIEHHEDYEGALSSASVSVGDTWNGSELVYSAGTTGRPKGVRPLGVYGAAPDDRAGPARHIAPCCGITANTVCLCAMPLYEPTSLQAFVAVQMAGGTVVTLAEPSAEAVLGAIGRYRGSHALCSVRVLSEMAGLPRATRARYDLSSLTLVIHTAAPCPAEVKRELLEWLGPIVCEFYGAAEGNGLTFITGMEWLRKPGSVGRSVLGTVRVCDADGHELPEGRVGLVYFDRPGRSFAYSNAPELTRSVMHPWRENWTTMGDIGYLEDGYLFLVDRKEFALTKDEGVVYPREVEDVLAEHPVIADVAVVGMHDGQEQLRLRAVIRAADGTDVGPVLARELIEHVSDRIAHWKVPDKVDFVRELPRVTTGKLIKRKVAAHYTVIDSVAV